jgi:hypothetical protein
LHPLPEIFFSHTGALATGFCLLQNPLGHAVRRQKARGRKNGVGGCADWITHDRVTLA